MNLYKLIIKRLFIARLPKMAGSSNVMIENQRGELLVVKANYKSYWSLPGGWIDKGESPLQAAVREISEEIGYEIGAGEVDLERVIHRHSSVTTTYQFVFRLLKTIPDSTKFELQAVEIDAYDWVSKDDVLNSKDQRDYNRSVESWANNDSFYIETKL